jgi:hypothetical protein
MAFVFRIPTDNVSDSVFSSARHLNLMDKIRSHIIQMNSNPLSPISRSQMQGSQIRKSRIRRSRKPQIQRS